MSIDSRIASNMLRPETLDAFGRLALDAPALAEQANLEQPQTDLQPASDIFEPVMLASAWEGEAHPHLLEAGDFQASGNDPASDLNLVDDVVDGLL